MPNIFDEIHCTDIHFTNSFFILNFQLKNSELGTAQLIVSKYFQTFLDISMGNLLSI